MPALQDLSSLIYRLSFVSLSISCFVSEFLEPPAQISPGSAVAQNDEDEIVPGGIGSLPEACLGAAAAQNNEGEIAPGGIRSLQEAHLRALIPGGSPAATQNGEDEIVPGGIGSFQMFESIPESLYTAWLSEAFQLDDPTNAYWPLNPQEQVQHTPVVYNSCHPNSLPQFPAIGAAPQRASRMRNAWRDARMGSSDTRGISGCTGSGHEPQNVPRTKRRTRVMQAAQGLGHEPQNVPRMRRTRVTQVDSSPSLSGPGLPFW